MERLSQFEQYPVRDIDHIVNWTQTRGFEVTTQPIRAWAHLHVLQRAQRVVRTELRGRADETERIVSGRRGGEPGGRLHRQRLQRQVEGSGHITGNPTQTEAIAAVRRDGNLEYCVRSAE